MPDPSSTCPNCGTALPEDSPQNLCPSCLMKQAFASRTMDGDIPPSQEPPPSPEEIADKFPQFEITECLGRGGMGVVYKARQKSLNRWVAIKVLAPEKVDDEKFAERFAREARTLAQLNHPNIVTVHDYGETGGLYYIVMEFVDGVNLRDLLRDGKIESAQALTIVPPICEALQYAHDKGIVHRDIKPENLLIDREGRVKIADFGIAAIIGDAGEHSGTPPYMAPEQAAHSQVDHRADIYALGAVLYEMLTGERPNSPLDLPSSRMRGIQLDIRIDDIVLRALSKEPERRYRTANEFRTVVETVADRSHASTAHPSPAPAAPTTPTAPPAKRGMFRRWWWIFLVMIPVAPLLGGLTGLVYGLLLPKEYEATAVYQARPEFDTQNAPPGIGLPAEGWRLPFPEHAAILRSQEFLRQALEELDLHDESETTHITPLSQVSDSIRLENIRGTDLMELKVRLEDPDLATKLANRLVYDLQTRLGKQKRKSFSFPEEKQTWDEIAPERIIVHQLATVPDRPVSPNYRLNLVVGATTGLVLSPLLALILIPILHRKVPDRRPLPATESKSPPPHAATSDSSLDPRITRGLGISIVIFSALNAVATLASLLLLPLLRTFGVNVPTRDDTFFPPFFAMLPAIDDRAALIGVLFLLGAIYIPIVSVLACIGGYHMYRGSSRPWAITGAIACCLMPLWWPLGLLLGVASIILLMINGNPATPVLRPTGEPRLSAMAVVACVIVAVPFVLLMLSLLLVG